MDHLTQILIQLFAILVAAKIGNEIFRRLGQPTVVGEILGGVVAGPPVLGVYQVNAETELFAEIGVVLLLFQVGLETRLHDLLRVGRTALAVGVLGVLLPFGGGFLAAELAGGDLALAVFLAAALTATSVGITSNVLRDLGALSTTSGRIILGAAVIDDVLAIMILSVATGVAAGGLEATRLVSLLVLAALFIGAVVIGGTRILARRRSILTDPEFAETPLLPGMIVMLGLAALASLIGLAAIIGAFLAGMVVGESSERHALEAEVAPVAAFFTPFFFGFIGAQVDVAGLANVDALVLLAGISVLAVLSKFVGAFIGALGEGRARATLVGWGMIPRGEVGIVVAGLGLSYGAIGSEMYSVVVGMAIITTLIVPPLLPTLVNRAERRGVETREPSPGERAAEAHERVGGVRRREEAEHVAEPRPSPTGGDVPPGERAAEAHERVEGVRRREDAVRVAEPEPSIEDPASDVDESEPSSRRSRRGGASE